MDLSQEPEKGHSLSDPQPIPPNSPFGHPLAGSGTPPRMNCIIEEQQEREQDGPNSSSLYNTPKRPSSLYSVPDANNSSGSLLCNQSFTFGGTASNNTDSRRHSFKYIPGPKLPPTSRNRSPIRLNRSPSPERSQNRRSSVILDPPFNFTSSSLQPPTSSSSNGSAGRTAFRKGHRYKHSSVSMNFFQEPEVKIPLNIAKSLPIPDFSDLKSNLPWPDAYIKVAIALAQSLLCIFTFQVGQFYSWNNFITLSHFILYDILGSAAIILVQDLSQFEVWRTGTIMFPFGLNRIDVLLSFASAISLCFVGLDLFFHVLEQIIVLFVESSNHEQHEDIVGNIPHTHFTHVLDSNFNLWYITLLVAITLSTFCLLYTFDSKKSSKFKTNNPLITIIYIVYLLLYPLVQSYTKVWDYVATCAISIFIVSYGYTIAKWTSTILLMGFSTNALAVTPLLMDQETVHDSPQRMVLERSRSTLPADIADTASSKRQPLDNNYETTVVKYKIKEMIEDLPQFRSNCKLPHEDLLISKVNFDLFIVLMKLDMSGGSNDEELSLRLAIDKCVKQVLPNAETTIEIERI